MAAAQTGSVPLKRTPATAGRLTHDGANGGRTADHVLDRLPYLPFLEPPRLPGLRPLAAGDWLVIDADYAAQMAQRRALLDTRGDELVAAPPGARAAAVELLDTALAALDRMDGFGRDGAVWRTPDDARVVVDRNRPLQTLGRLVAEDFCLLSAGADGRHRLDAAVLCFPSSWRLADKLGRPLDAIHAPVPDYDGALAERVERVLSRLRVDRPVWRCNWLIHASPALYLPPGSAADLCGGYYLRTERQTLSRLPASGAVVFTIKTSLCRLDALAAAEARALLAAVDALDAATLRYKAGSADYADARRTLLRLTGP